MDAAYLQAAVPEPFKIFGKKLKPFCLGHEILFQRFGVGFSIEKPLPLREFDLLAGFHICSREYSPDYSLEDFSIPIRARVGSLIYGSKYIETMEGMFALYVASHARIPDFYSLREGRGAKSGSPTVQTVKVSLMANLGISEAEALNMPFSLAFWNHLTWGESQRAIQIIDDAEREKIQKCKDLEEWANALAEKMKESYA
jgi:hypothetical protein